MKRMIDRSHPSYLHPDWTEEELCILIDEWKNLVANHQPKKYQGGLDNELAQRFSQRTNKTRTPTAIGGQRSKLYQAARFISHFDEMQQSCGRQLWFDLSKQDRDGVEMPGRIRRVCYNLTQESYNTLLKLKSVRKWTTAQQAVTKPKTNLKSDIKRRETCNSCWSTSEVTALVRSWSLVMKKSSTSVGDFVAQSSADSATSYTPWNHSTISAWRKMKRIVTSYLFIRHFNDRHSPAKWFQLSDGGQNMWLDWNALPADFEDIPQEIFDEIHQVDFPTPSQTAENEVEILEDLDEAGDSTMESSPLFDNFSGSDESEKSTEDDPKSVTLSPPWLKLRTKSPHLPCSSPTRDHKSVQQVRDSHQECNAFYDHMEQLQTKQFKQAIQRLRTEIERDIRLGTDMTRAIFFERLGNPDESGDATFVANLLEEQQRQVRDRFVQFQREHVFENVFDASLDS